MLGVNRRFDQRLSLSARYFLGWARSDTDGAGSFPADSNDPAADWGRSSIDVRHRVMLMGSVTLPGDVRLSPFVIASTGGPFNITIGRDVNGDTVFTDRPSYASSASEPGVVETPWGLLNPTPAPGEAIVPRNLGTSPGFFTVNLRVSKSIRLAAGRTAATPATPGAPGDAPGGPGGPPAAARRTGARRRVWGRAALAADRAGRAASADPSGGWGGRGRGPAGPGAHRLALRAEPLRPHEPGRSGRQLELAVLRRVARERRRFRPRAGRPGRRRRGQPLDRAAGPRVVLASLLQPGRGSGSDGVSDFSTRPANAARPQASRSLHPPASACMRSATSSA